MKDIEEKDQLLQKIEALSKQVAALSQLYVPVTTNTYTLYEWFEEWLTVYKEKEVGTSGLYQLRNCIDKHLKPHIPDKPLEALTVLELDKALGTIESTRMRKYAHDTLCAALHKAFSVDIMRQDLSVKIQTVSHTRKKRAALTLEEEKRFLDIIPTSRYYLLWLFYLVSGVRRSEALAVRWSDVDEVDGMVFISGTKTVAAKRFIPLFDDIRFILERLPHTSEYLFPYPLYSIKNAWRYMQKKYGLPYSLHNLRHTFATRHHENGIPDNVIQYWLGHSNVKTTQDIYIHLTDRYAKDLADKANTLRRLISPLPETLYRKSKRDRQNNV